MNPTDMAIRIVSLIILLVLFVVPASSRSYKFWPFKGLSLIALNQSTSEQQVDIGPRLINTRVGKQQISAIMDLNDNLIWAICVPSNNNTSPFYNPSNSSTFANISCGACPSPFNNHCRKQCSYGVKNSGIDDFGIDDFGSYGYLVSDHFPVGANYSSNSTKATFGCVDYNDSSSAYYSTDYFNDPIYGVIGFGNSNLSLTGQLGCQRFSYCLSANASEATTVKFNSNAVITGNKSQSIQLITYPHDRYYYFNLTQITVGTTTVTLNTSLNTTMDTYYPYLHLDYALYNSTRDAFLNEMGLSIVESNDSVQDLCFNKGLIMPSLVLQFDGSVNVTLETSAYVVKHPNTSKKCLSIYPNIGDNLTNYRDNHGKIYPNGNNLRFNILGNLMQVDMNMVFDLEKKILSFEKVKCTSSAKTFIPSGDLVLVVLLFSFLVM
ncbi:hypothetical protein LUZ60_001381 [Juncus effusus]|nr:hypothetical protein LUZ60_001381 [Juncus effusus]